jgi:hypothetical protein
MVLLKHEGIDEQNPRLCTTRDCTLAGSLKKTKPKFIFNFLEKELQKAAIGDKHRQFSHGFDQSRVEPEPSLPCESL